MSWFDDLKQACSYYRRSPQDFGDPLRPGAPVQLGVDDRPESINRISCTVADLPINRQLGTSDRALGARRQDFERSGTASAIAWRPNSCWLAGSGDVGFEISIGPSRTRITPSFGTCALHGRRVGKRSVDTRAQAASRAYGALRPRRRHRHRKAADQLVMRVGAVVPAKELVQGHRSVCWIRHAARCLCRNRIEPILDYQGTHAIPPGSRRRGRLRQREAHAGIVQVAGGEWPGTTSRSAGASTRQRAIA